MPLVRIDIMEGRPPEKIRELHSRVAALVAEILDTPIERVRTYITQFPPEGWGIGGVPADVARADEVAARREASAGGFWNPLLTEAPTPPAPRPFRKSWPRRTSTHPGRISSPMRP